ncbi:MAG: hypothetical protein P4L86_13075 [Mycobacterium sp.]|nr:hypothetical protein [Mycobacterium sp.]
MTTSWYVCKYVSDLMRDEPRNLGVIVHDDAGELRFRFVGERADGVVDGRRAQSWVNSIDTYKLWVKHWKKLACVDGALKVEPRRIDDNYYLSHRMASVMDADSNLPIDDLANQLFASLVSGHQELVETLKDQVQVAFQRLDVVDRIKTDTDVIVKVGDVLDTLRFDYQYKSESTTALMERINLASADQRSWNNVHAASWMFTAAEKDERHQSDSRIALVRTGASDRKAQLDQMRVLGRVCEVVDFSDSKAERRLAELLAA